MLLNAQGQPVATQIVAIQIDIPVPTEAVASMTAPDWWKVVTAVIGLVSAFSSGNPAAIAAAIQALFVAIMGG